MDPIRTSRTMMAGGLSSTPEGKVERRDERKGTVVVRLPGNETIEAQGSGLSPGDRVTLAKSPDGTWVARPMVRQDSSQAPVLSSWMTEPPGSELGEALRSGEPRMIRSALVALWKRLDANPEGQELPPALQESRRRGIPPLVARNDTPSRGGAVPSAVPMALRAETSPGLYRGEIPGRRFELVGPPGIRLGEAGLWTESVISEILSVWTPTAVEDGGVPGLPARVAADAAGARRLLDHLGVELSTEDEQSPSFRALVRSLVRAGAMFLGEASPEAEGPVAPTSPGSTPPGPQPATIAAPALGNPTTTGAGGAPQSPLSVRPSLSNPAGSPDAVRTTLSKAFAESRIPTPSASDPAPGSSSTTVAFPEADILPANGVTPTQEMSPDPLTGGSMPVASRERTPTIPEAGIPSSVVPAVSGGRSDVPDSSAKIPAVSVGASAVVRELPAAVALRVVLAWLVSAEEPSESLLRAAVGGFRELPEALQSLARAQDLRPEDFEAVATFLRHASPEEPLLPRDLGLDRAAPKGALGQDPNPARPLSQAIVEDLARALSQGRNDDAAVLREALGSLVGEALDGARDPSNPMASAPWTMPPSQERPDSGRVVVRDRRRSRDETSEKTVVEVSMNPSGLGSVDARLELRGDDLDVVFHAREVATVDRIRDHLPELRSVLMELGLQPRDLDARAGKPGVAKRAADVRESTGGLDIRA